MRTNPDPPTYDPSGFDRLAEAEDSHFWFRARSRLIGWSLRRYFPAAGSFCDVGCGTGSVLGVIERGFPALRTSGIEPLPEGLEWARRRLRRTCLLQGDILNLPKTEQWDVIGVFDVLEHIPDDARTISCLHAALPPGGGLILTVPQHQWLWSAADDIGFHQRRYSRRELAAKVSAAGFRILRLTSFVSALLPAMWASRRIKPSPSRAFGELRIGRWANGIGRIAMACDLGLIRAGVSLPAGGSLLLVPTKG